MNGETYGKTNRKAGSTREPALSCSAWMLTNLAPRAGFEPATCRLTVECSTAELPGNTAGRGVSGVILRTVRFAKRFFQKNFACLSYPHLLPICSTSFVGKKIWNRRRKPAALALIRQLDGFTSVLSKHRCPARKPVASSSAPVDRGRRFGISAGARLLDGAGRPARAVAGPALCPPRTTPGNRVVGPPACAPAKLGSLKARILQVAADGSAEGGGQPLAGIHRQDSKDRKIDHRDHQE